MTTDQFTEWAQEMFDSCNVFNEMETSKVIVEVMKKFYSLNKEEIVQESVTASPILRQKIVSLIVNMDTGIGAQ